ncbi:MAG TPA: PilZ domain-containing protein [Phycisphaerae bacterium]|nr:PilZ domain-containing protein [Phycisphaerae bacterium]
MTRKHFRQPVPVAELLVEAASKRTPAVLSCKDGQQWVSVKSRLLDASQADGRLVVEYPAGQQGQRAPDITRGQYVGVAFRRGHKKCVFGSYVVGKERFQLDRRNLVGALMLGWPAEIGQFQRRAYFRVEVPPGQTVATYLWPGGATARPRAGSPGWPLYVTQLVDLSAGGFRVEVPVDEDPKFAVEQTVGMEFVVEPNRPPIIADANFRHSEPGPEGRVHLGFQFVGLELDGRGRTLLERLARITSHWRQGQLKVGASRR